MIVINLPLFFSCANCKWRITISFHLENNLSICTYYFWVESLSFYFLKTCIEFRVYFVLSKPNEPSKVAKEGVAWAKIGDKFRKVDTCNVSYATKRLFWSHLDHKYLVMEYNKSLAQRAKRQNHSSMNVHVLNNPLAKLRCNNQKMIH